MAKEITADMTDEQVTAILEELGGDQDAMKDAIKNASPRQAFMVAIPWGIKSQPDVAGQLAGIEGSIAWVIEGEGGGSYCLQFGDGDIKVEEGDFPDATATVKLDLDTWKEMSSGETNPQAAFMAGKVQIEGDLSLLMQIQGVMPAM